MPTSDPLSRAFIAMKDSFRRQPYPTAEQRIQWLDTLKDLLLSHQDALIATISDDFGQRSSSETRLLELVPLLTAIRYHKKRLRRWMKPSRRLTPLLYQPARSRVNYVPLGVVGIIVPWNYPLFLAISPMISALAAGNRVMVKMSESVPKTGLLLDQLFQKHLGSDVVQIFNGDVGFARAFTRLPFDHLIFTGATGVGRHVMEAAAENLTPVTLELGGKSPVIISRNIPISVAAKRLVWPKVLNNGQSCTAPDYIFCPEELLEDFITAFRAEYLHQFPSLDHNPDSTSIINDMHYQRLTDMLKDAEAKGATLLPLHKHRDDGSRIMPITLMTQVTDDMTVMQEEIFGPILPIMTYQTLDRVYDYIASRPHPLALYFFGYDKQEWQTLGQRCHTGALVINDAAIHPGNDALPFGGVGASGMGVYHEREGFVALSNLQSEFVRGRLSLSRIIGAPPYKRLFPRLLQKLFIR